MSPDLFMLTYFFKGYPATSIEFKIVYTQYCVRNFVNGHLQRHELIDKKQ